MVLESLKQPVINGYLIAGSLVGPGGLKLVKVADPCLCIKRGLHCAACVEKQLQKRSSVGRNRLQHVAFALHLCHLALDLRQFVMLRSTPVTACSCLVH